MGIPGLIHAELQIHTDNDAYLNKIWFILVESLMICSPIKDWDGQTDRQMLLMTIPLQPVIRCDSSVLEYHIQ